MGTKRIKFENKDLKLWSDEGRCFQHQDQGDPKHMSRVCQGVSEPQILGKKRRGKTD